MYGHRDYPPRMRIHWFAVLLLFAPTIVCGILFYYGYNNHSMNEEEAERLHEQKEEIEDDLWELSSSYVTHYFKLSNGNSIAVTNETGGLLINEWDATSLEMIQSTPIETIIFNDIVPAYQNDGIVMLTATEDSESRYYYYESGKEVKTLDFPTIVDSAFIDQTSILYDQTLYTVGQNEHEEFIVIMVKDGEAETVNLTEMPDFSLLIDARFDNPSLSVSGEIYPILNLRMYDNESYYIVLAPNRSGNYPIMKDLSTIHQKDDILYEDFFEASIPYIHIYQNEPHLSSLDYSVDRVKLETPEKVFYPKLFHLAHNNVLILGKSSINESATNLGYIYDATGSELRFDLTPFIQENAELFSDYEQSSFQVQLQDDILYTMSDQQANALDLAAGTSMVPADDEIFNQVLSQYTTQLAEEADEVLETGKENTEEKFNDYLNHSTSAKTIGIVWLSSTLGIALILSIPFMITRRYVKNIQTAYDNGGGRVQAVVQEVHPTGLYINEEPHADLVVSFTHGFQQYERTMRLMTNIKTPAQVGDTIELIYDPRLDKLYEIKYKQDDAYGW